MSTTVQQAPAQGQSILLYNISWPQYVRMGRLLADRPLRMTYDRGTLEIMTLSSLHERLKHFLGRFVEVLSEELNIPIAGYGSMTCRRRKKQRGFEPDECYWIANEVAVRGKDHIDLRLDPPPDLGLEIDVAISSLDRISIYAALNVPEVWRMNSDSLTFHGLQGDGKYTVIASSIAFPGLTPDDLMSFIVLRGTMDENSVIRDFRPWVRQRFNPSNPSP